MEFFEIKFDESFTAEQKAGVRATRSMRRNGVSCNDLRETKVEPISTGWLRAE